MSSRARVGISRCLMGDEVRYDGTHRLDETVIALLGPYVEWVPVCPEVELGMGIPREPVQLVGGAEGASSDGRHLRLIGVRSGEDWTERMAVWTRSRVSELTSLDLSGYVFKARSPSCGIDDVVIHGGDGQRRGRGLFAQALIDALPSLPVADEASLADPAVRADFLDLVLRHHAAHRSG